MNPRAIPTHPMSCGASATASDCVIWWAAGRLARAVGGGVRLTVVGAAGAYADKAPLWAAVGRLDLDHVTHLVCHVGRPERVDLRGSTPRADPLVVGRLRHVTSQPTIPERSRSAAAGELPGRRFSLSSRCRRPGRPGGSPATPRCSSRDVAASVTLRLPTHDPGLTVSG
jgi:hypothetical protein